MARAPLPPVDPAADAAALLRRLGFATLMVAVPVAALVARRAVVVLAPIGVALLVIAALLDRDHDGIVPDLKRIVTSPGGLAGTLLLGWMVLSLAWTPFRAAASERALNILAVTGMMLAVYLALPGRMRVANLYLAPVGVAAAAILAGVLALSDLAIGRAVDEDGAGLERGIMVLVATSWPALAWLRSRGRDLEALALAVAVAVAALMAPVGLPFAAFAVGGVVFALASIGLRLGVAGTAAALAGAVALAPLAPFVLRPVAALVLRRNDPLLVGLDAWRRVIGDDPLRFLIGRGFETAARGRFTGFLRPDAPISLPFDIWYDLGIVGAGALATALYAAVRAAGRAHAGLVPGAMAAFATAFTLCCLGVTPVQLWWFTTLWIAAFVFLAADRGQFRTRRPKAVSGVVRR